MYKKGAGHPMKKEETIRKKLDNQEFVKLRQATEKIAQFLNKRITVHADILRPLFIPRKLLGPYVKSSVSEEVPKAEKAFTDLRELYFSVCEKPFSLLRRLQPPIPPISNFLEAVPLKYPLSIESAEKKTIDIISPTRWILSYRSDVSLDRLKSMVADTGTRQIDEMSHAIIGNLTPVIFLKYFPALNHLLEDLRYKVEIKGLVDLGNMPVVVLTAPIDTFLPPDDFILQVTQISGIDAFQEIINLEAVESMTDSLKDELKNLIG